MTSSPNSEARSGRRREKTSSALSDRHNNNKTDGENIEAKKVVERTFPRTTFFPLIA